MKKCVTKIPRHHFVIKLHCANVDAHTMTHTNAMSFWTLSCRIPETVSRGRHADASYPCPHFPLLYLDGVLQIFHFNWTWRPDLNIEYWSTQVPYCVLPKYQTVTPAGIMRGCISTQASLSITCARPATVVGRSHCFAADLSAALPAVWRYEWRGKRVRRATRRQTWQPPLAIGIVSKPLPLFLSLYHHHLRLVASSCQCQYFKICLTQFESCLRMGT